MNNNCYFWIIFLVFGQLFDRNVKLLTIFALFGTPYERRLTSFGIFRLFMIFGCPNIIKSLNFFQKILLWSFRRLRTPLDVKVLKITQICQNMTKDVNGRPRAMPKTSKCAQNCPFLTKTVLSRPKTLNFCFWLMNFNRCMLKCLIMRVFIKCQTYAYA